MFKRLLFLIISATILVALYGCHAGGHAPFINVPNDEQVTTLKAVVDENGIFQNIVFPSGATIRCSANSTFLEGTEITAEERKTTINEIPTLLYTLTATYDSVNLTNTIEHPLIVTLPNNSNSGVCYIGLREDSNSDWHFSLATDGIANIRFARLQASSPKNCTFNLFKVSIQFALFVFQDNKDDPKVDSVEAAAESPVDLKDGKYAGNLGVKLSVDGENLGSVDTTSLVARITYRSNNPKGANISFATNPTDKLDKTHSNSYEHSFEITGLTKDSVLGNRAELSFVLNLNGVSLEDFPTYFLIEVYSKISTTGSNIRPFTYTQGFSFETKEPDNPEPQPEDDFYTLALNCGTGIASVEGKGNYKANESVTVKCSIKDGYEFDSWSGDKTGATIELTFKMPENNVTMTANAKAITYNIVYVLDGGALSEEVTNPTKFSVETETFTLKNPTKDGFTFTGWTGSNGNTPERVVKIEKGTTGDKTYTANYSAVAYTITFSLGADDVINDNPTGFNPDTETFTLNEPTRTGYTFTGWTGSNGDTPQKEVTIAKGTTEKKSYTANWSINSYNLTLNKGTGINSVTGAGNHEYNSKVTASCTMLAGYEFEKWTGDFTTEIFNMPAKNVTLTANAKIITYSIAYDLDKGQLTKDNPSDYTVETESITLTNPTKANYEFIGWSGTDLTGSNNTTVTIVKGSTGAREYKANFTPTNFTITYKNSDGSDLTTTNPTNYNIESDDITLTNPTKTGYEFAGWTYEGQNTPQTEVKINKGSTGNKAFTANFNKRITLAIAADDGVIIDDVNCLYYTKATFTITPTLEEGLTLADTEKANILSAISVKDTAGTSFGNATATWNNDGKIALSFSKDLTASTTFTISFGKIDGLALTCTALSFKTFYFKGKGTTDNRYQVESAEQLDYVRNYLDKHYIQTADIDLGEYTTKWSAIGESDQEAFTGSYNGNNKKIKNLKIHSSEYMKYVGLFGYIKSIKNTDSGKIENLTIDAFSLRGSSEGTPLNASFVGVIAGSSNSSSITNCHLTDSSASNATNSQSIVIFAGSENNELHVGGICAYLDGTISNCSVEKCKFKNTAESAGTIKLGGICGYNIGGISQCYLNEMLIDCSSSNLQKSLELGGINAVNFGSISGCYVKNTSITASALTKGLQLGGICGWDKVGISNCYVENTRVKGRGESAKIGGIIGVLYVNAIPTSCYVNNSAVESEGNLCNVGGISGKSENGISLCHIYNTIVKSNGDSCLIGGICGNSRGTRPSARSTTCASVARTTCAATTGRASSGAAAAPHGMLAWTQFSRPSRSCAPSQPSCGASSSAWPRSATPRTSRTSC